MDNPKNKTKWTTQRARLNGQTKGQDFSEQPSHADTRQQDWVGQVISTCHWWQTLAEIVLRLVESYYHCKDSTFMLSAWLIDLITKGLEPEEKSHTHGDDLLPAGQKHTHNATSLFSKELTFQLWSIAITASR